MNCCGDYVELQQILNIISQLGKIHMHDTILKILVLELIRKDIINEN